jgi:hypothetical protein
MKSNLKNVFATALGISLLIGSLYLLVTNLIQKPDQNMAFTFGCLLLIPMSLYYWNGRGGVKLGISSAAQWLGVFVGGIVLTSVSFLIDCGTGFLFHSGTSSCEAGTHGLGFMFTLAGAGLTIVAGAGAIRAVVIKWLTR